MPTDEPDATGGAEEVRAEEIIATVYGRIREQRESGKRVTAIILPVEMYRTVQAYRNSLGDAPEGLPDYLGKYELFGVPLYTDGGDRIVIQTAR